MKQDVKIYPDGDRYRIAWYDPKTGKRRMARRSDYSEAEAVKEHLETELLRAQPGQKLGHRSFQNLLDYYLYDLKQQGVSGSYLYRQESICRLWLSKVGGIKCKDLQPHHFRHVLAQGREKGLADGTLKNHVATMTGVVACGHEAGYIDPQTNPAEKLHKLLRTTSRAGVSGRFVDPKRIPTVAEVDRLAVYMGQRWEWWRELQVKLAAFSGLRLGEMTALRAIDVDLGQSTIDVCRAWGRIERRFLDPKWNKVRTTFVASSVVGLLEARMEEVGPGGLLFPRQNRDGAEGDVAVDYNMMFYQTRFNPARKELGWPKDPNSDRRWLWTWHSLRHVFCSWALANPPKGLGLSAVDVAYFAGHHSPEFTLSRYVSIMDGAVDRAAAASAAFASQGAGTR